MSKREEETKQLTWMESGWEKEQKQCKQWADTNEAFPLMERIFHAKLMKYRRFL